MPSTHDGVSTFPPHVLREYALLADGERGILVGPRGDLVWMCAPRWDSDAVFSSLLGGSGAYAVTPTDPQFVWGGEYEAGSLIWRSRWITEGRNIIECREALAFPGSPHTAVVLRRVIAVEGDAKVGVELDARAGFGSHRMSKVSERNGVWTARSGPLHMRWSGAGGASVGADGVLRTELTISEGGHHDLVLEISERHLDEAVVEPGRAWEATSYAWAQAVSPVSGTIADRDARHALAVLRGLSSPGGGMVAAATMSLPERAEQGRNYDYRFCWVRDQCYAGQAAAAADAGDLVDEAVRFVAQRVLEDGAQLKPAYTNAGGAVPDEHPVDLPGYPGSSVKTGNWVNSQFQLDAFGEALLLFAAAGREDRLNSENWRAVEATVAAIAKRWGDPDAGIWELDNTRWAHSRLICAAGLRAAGAVAPVRQGADWNHLADMIVADASRDCLHPSGRWQRAPGDPRVDAALLLPGIHGALPAGDPRTRATVDAVRTDLGREGYVYRFRHDDRPLHDAEGAFVLCGFLMALATHQQGEPVEAARWFERNRVACGPPGLFAEEYDIRQRQLRGNLPQAFVHALLLQSAHELAGIPTPGSNRGAGDFSDRSHDVRRGGVSS